MAECCRWDFKCPRGWQILQPWGNGFALMRGGLRVIVDCSEKADGHCWLHLSVSRAKEMPSHADMAIAKEAFLGDRYAYSVFPPKDKYVNIHMFCLHLWARIDGEAVLPEFSEVIEEIGQRSI